MLDVLANSPKQLLTSATSSFSVFTVQSHSSKPGNFRLDQACPKLLANDISKMTYKSEPETAPGQFGCVLSGNPLRLVNQDASQPYGLRSVERQAGQVVTLSLRAAACRKVAICTEMSPKVGGKVELSPWLGRSEMSQGLN